MSVAELITIIIMASSLVTALYILWNRIIRPIKIEIKQIEENSIDIKKIDEKIAKINIDRARETEFDADVRSVLIESLIAVLDGLEQVGANHTVSEQKKKLINFLTKQVRGN